MDCTDDCGDTDLDALILEVDDKCPGDGDLDRLGNDDFNRSLTGNFDCSQDGDFTRLCTGDLDPSCDSDLCRL